MSSATVFALIVFVIAYILMFTIQKLRPMISVAAAILFVIVGSLGIFPEFRYSVIDALSEIDWNVLMMISGTMGTVYLFIDSRMPMQLSDFIIARVSSVKWMVLALSLFAGLISAFVDNVATVLMIAPVALAICKRLDISPVPAIICISVSSNLQGAATLVGDTTSILLAKAAGLDFMDFFVTQGKPGMFFVTECGALASALIVLWMFRKENTMITLDDRTYVEDYVPTVLLVLTIVTLILASFIPYKDNAAPGQFYKPDITNGLICIGFFVIGLIRQIVKEKSPAIIREAIKKIDFPTIILLFGLFIVIGGIFERFFKKHGRLCRKLRFLPVDVTDRFLIGFIALKGADLRIGRSDDLQSFTEGVGIDGSLVGDRVLKIFVIAEEVIKADPVGRFYC